jgi:hypothetical protein
VSRGSAIGAIAKIASVKSLITNLFIDFSRFESGQSYTEACCHEHPQFPNIPRRRPLFAQIRPALRGMKNGT